MEQKYLQTTTFLAVGKRAVLMGAVGNHAMAVDNSCQYRPQESPANRRIIAGAGDAVGTLRRLSSTFSLYRDLLTNQGLFKAASNVVVAEELALGGLGPIEMVQAFKAASTRVSIRVGIKIGGAPRRGGDEHDRAAGFMPVMPPREPAGEPFLRVVRRPAD